MNRETIEKAAKNFIKDFCYDHIDYTSINYEEDNYEAARNNTLWEFGTEIFMAGADWRINSVWHDVNEEPIYWKLIIRKDILGDYDLGCELKHDTISWAYLDDLVPERKEETK